MRKILLSAALLSAAFGYSQTFDNIPTGTGFYINKLIVSPDGSDLTKELIEIRGTPNAIVPTDLWLVAIEGDSNTSSYGRVSEEIQLGDGTRTFGANGILAIVCDYTDEVTLVETTNPYTALMSPDASVLTIALTGDNVAGGSSNNVSSQTPDIGYDGNFSDASASYMLISGSDPDNVFIDGPSAGDGLPFDGVIDTVGDHTAWTLYDSVAYIDDDHTTNEGGGIERAYAQIVFAQDMATNGANQTATTSANIIDYAFGTTDPSIILRQGTSTGYDITDWAIGDTSGSAPNWEFDADSLPVEFEDFADLNTVYGDLNPVLSVVLSTGDFSINGESITAYQPTSGTIAINGIEVDAANVYALNGAVVAKGAQTVDVSTLATGIYILQVESNGKSTSKTMVVK